MTEVQFFEKVHQKYKDSNHLLEGDGGYRIKRGMAQLCQAIWKIYLLST
jgi:hypothetical protein